MHQTSQAKSTPTLTPNGGTPVDTRPTTEVASPKSSRAQSKSQERRIRKERVTTHGTLKIKESAKENEESMMSKASRASKSSGTCKRS